MAHHREFMTQDPSRPSHPDVHHRAAQRVLNAASPPPGCVLMPLWIDRTIDPLTGEPWAWPLHQRTVTRAEFEALYPRHGK